MQKLWSYSILHALATVPVLLIETSTGPVTGDRAWYRFRIAVCTVGSGTGAKSISGRVLVSSLSGCMFVLYATTR